MTNIFDKDVAIAITTFDRPGCLTTLLASIQIHHPGIHVYVADDGYDAAVNSHKLTTNCTYYRLPCNVGLSAKRNYLVDNIVEPYVILMDDDFVIRGYTNLVKLYEIITANDLDMVAGWARSGNRPDQYAGNIRREGSTVYLTLLSDITQGSMQQEWYRCDLVQNFFIAKVAALRNCKWDPVLRMCEHWEYFYRAKDLIKIAYCPGVVIDHVRPAHTDDHYSMHRHNVWSSLVAGLAKHQVNLLVTPSSKYELSACRAKDAYIKTQHKAKKPTLPPSIVACAKLHKVYPPGGRPSPATRQLTIPRFKR